MSFVWLHPGPDSSCLWLAPSTLIHQYRSHILLPVGRRFCSRSLWVEWAHFSSHLPFLSLSLNIDTRGFIQGMATAYFEEEWTAFIASLQELGKHLKECGYSDCWEGTWYDKLWCKKAAGQEGTVQHTLIAPIEAFNLLTFVYVSFHLSPFSNTLCIISPSWNTLSYPVILTPALPLFFL